VGGLIGFHLLLVRRRGVVRPLPVRTGRHTSTTRDKAPAAPPSSEGVDR
jgi:hypothetical protein